MTSFFTWTGASRYPPSVAITHMRGGTATPSGSIRNISYVRALEPLMNQKRYRFGSTFRYGHAFPFTTMVSPTNSGVQYGCSGFVAQSRPPALSACMKSWPFVSNVRSWRTIGTV